MINLHLLDNPYLWGTAHQVIEQACAARLGYEAAALIEEGVELAISPRAHDTGIGVDSYIVNPLVERGRRMFHVPRCAGSYHGWSLFGFSYRRPNEPLSDVVIHNIPAIEIKASLGFWPGRDVHAFGQSYKSRNPLAIMQEKIDLLKHNPDWRRCAMDFSRQLAREALTEFDVNSAKILEELDDIDRGQRVVGTAQPVMNATWYLLDMYAHEMGI